jgi:hypothetical protein
MNDDEIRAEVARQIRDAFATVAAQLREKAKTHGPVVGKALRETADEIDQVARTSGS